MATSLGLGITISGKDLSGRALRGAATNVTDLKSKTMDFKTAATKAFAGVTAAIATMKATIGVTAAFADFEQELAGLGAVTGASKEELAQFSAVAKQANLDTKFSATEATQGLRNLATQGFTAKQSIEALSGTLDLAAGGQLSVASAAEVVASSMNVFGIEAAQATEVADKLLKITTKTALQSHQLQIGLANVSAGAISTKQGLDEMLPSLGLVVNAGLDASVAGTSISRALSQMAAKAKDFKALGVSVTDAQGNFRPFLDIALETKTELDKIADASERAAKTTDLFGEFGKKSFGAISKALDKGIRTAEGELLKGADAIEFLRESMANAGGTAQSFREQLNAGLKGTSNLLAGTAELLKIEVGEAIGKVLTPMVGQLNDSLIELTKTFGAISPDTKRAIGSFILMTAAAVSLGGAVSAISTAASLLGISLAPVVGAVALATVLTVAFSKALSAGDANAMAISDSLDSIASRGMSIFETLKSGVMSFFSGVKAGFDSVDFGPVFAEAFDAIDMLMAGVQGLVSGFGDGTSAGVTFGKLIGAAVQIIVKGFTLAVKFISAVVNQVNALGGLFEPVTSAFSEVGSQVSTILTDLGLLGSNATGAAGALSMIGRILGVVLVQGAKLLGAAVRGVGGGLTALITIGSGVVDFFRGVFAGDLTMAFQGIAKVFGGIMKGMIAMIGAFIQALASALDTAGRLAGVDIGAEAKVRGLQEKLVEGIDNVVLRREVQPMQETNVAAQAKAAVDAVQASVPPSPPPPVPPAGPFGPATGMAALDPSAIAQATTQGVQQAMAAMPRPTANVTVQIDGQEVAAIIQGDPNAASAPVGVTQ